MHALISAARTLRPTPAPRHNGDRLAQLSREASIAFNIIGAMIDTAVVERQHQYDKFRSYDVPITKLCDRLYRLHARMAARSSRRTQAYMTWIHEHTCPGIERPCGCSALNAYHTTTGTDLETARPVTLYYCDKHFRELATLAELVPA